MARSRAPHAAPGYVRRVRLWTNYYSPQDTSGCRSASQVEGAGRVAPWSDLTWDRGIATYPFAFSHFLRVELQGNGTRNNVAEDVVLEFDVPSEFEQWNAPGEYLGSHTVRAALVSEGCSLRVPATIDITAADLGRSDPMAETRVAGSLVAAEGDSEVHVSFELMGCHTNDVSGP